jgi:DNA gyrase subunit B
MQDKNKMTEQENTETTQQSQAPVYDASIIKILEGLEAVRKRPGNVYRQPARKAAFLMCLRSLDNAIDESAGRTQRRAFTVHVHVDYSCYD